MAPYGRVTKISLKDLAWMKDWDCQSPSITGTRFGLELAQLAYDFKTEPWTRAGWTDIAIQVDHRLLTGVGALEEGGDWRQLLLNSLVPRFARRLKAFSNPITQIKGLKDESLLYDTGKAITMLKPLTDGRYAVAIGFSGTGRRPQDWVSNTRFEHPDKLHIGFESLSELYNSNAQSIVFPTAARELGLEELTLRDVLEECHRENSRFILLLSGHSQGAAVLQIWAYKRLAEGLRPEYLSGMGFACPLVASGMDPDQRACPLALFVNRDDVFTRLGLKEHLGQVWTFTPDEHFRQKSYADVWENPLFQEMLATLNDIKNTRQALIILLGFLEALETVPRKEAGAALGHMIQVMMAQRLLPLAEDTVAKILRFMRMSLRRYHLRLTNESVTQAEIDESTLFSQRMLVRYPALEIVDIFVKTLISTHSLARDAQGEEDLAPYSFMAVRAFDSLEKMAG